MTETISHNYTVTTEEMRNERHPGHRLIHAEVLTDADDLSFKVTVSGRIITYHVDMLSTQFSEAMNQLSWTQQAKDD